MDKLTFDITIDAKGQWHSLPNIRELVYKKFAKEGIDVHLQMEFIGVGKQRTDDQNKYYWGVVVPLTLAGFRLMGNDVHLSRSSDHLIIHEMLKDKFGFDDLNLVDRNGEVHTIKKSTSAMDTKKFSQYVEDIRKWVHHNLSIDIPDADRPMEIWDKAGNMTYVSVKDFLKTIL